MHIPLRLNNGSFKYLKPKKSDFAKVSYKNYAQHTYNLN